MKLCYPLKVTKRNITSGYGNRTLKDGTVECHKAWDDQEPLGTPILACYDGFVHSVKSDAARGKYVSIWHKTLDNGVGSQYQHCQSIVVNANQQVWKGDVIGYVGSTGKSSGPHLDFSMGTNITAAGYLDKATKFNPDRYEWEFYNAVDVGPATIHPLPTSGKKYMVAGTSLSVRNKPGLISSIVGSLSGGDVVTITVGYGTWGKIGENQWCSIKPAYLKPGVKYRINAGTLNIRNGPAPSFADVGDVKFGDVVDVFNTNGTWGQISKGGWISIKPEFVSKV